MRKKVFAAVIVFLTLTVFVSDPTFAAWTQAKGHAYNQLTVSQYVTGKKFTTVQADYDNIVKGTGDDIRVIRTAGFVSESISYYGEYGITDTLTVFTSIPWKWTKSDDTRRYAGSDGANGVGDIDLGLRYNLTQNVLGTGTVMSIQGAVKIPEAYEYGHPLKELSLGDGQYDAKLELLFGRGFGKGYAGLTAGYKYRFENSEHYSFKPSDQVSIKIWGGYAVLSWLSIRGLVDWTKSVGNARVSDELIIENYQYGVLSKSKDNVLIRDTLGLEPSYLNASMFLVFNITQKIQTVLSYGTDLKGIPPFESRDSAKGETFSVAWVYKY